MTNTRFTVNREKKPRMIYCYITPEVAYHEGWVKIGESTQDIETRIKQQTKTADIKTETKWHHEAVFDDGSGDTFHDYDFHRYLKKHGVKNRSEKGSEWFYINSDLAEKLFERFKNKRDYDPLDYETESIPYQLRPEQQRAIDQTATYYNENPNGKFLWNAKPRFGKTLCVYEFCRKIHANHILIVTNRPVVVTSWYNDYVKFVQGWKEGYRFATDSDDLKKHVAATGSEYHFVDTDSRLLKNSSYFTFISLQDLKGSLYFGGEHDKLKHIRDTKWDVLIVDESHEGVDTIKTDTAFDQLNYDFALYLSGTPFKALASKDFENDQIFNWTYIDEQEAKRNWNGPGENPYEDMPSLNLYTYKMSDIIRDKIKEGPDLDGDNNDAYAFDMNEFFSLDESGHFRHLDAVKKFIRALTTQKKFPYSTKESKIELRHTLWIMDRVDSAKEMARLLRDDKDFYDYQIIPAVGDGKLSEEDENEKAFDRVIDAIHENEEKGFNKTITISVGQLTTGVTIPEWSGVLMLSNISSPSLYMQAAFRAQNPCESTIYLQKKRIHLQKINAYIFDFDPARTLNMYEYFANGLYSNTASGNGTIEERTEHIKKLLNFFPVIGEDQDGEMIPLDTEEVLNIPRKIRSTEVVDHGFMDNYLFQNISRVFSAPKVVSDILNKFEPVSSQTNKKESIPDNIGSGLDLDDDGNIVDLNKIAIGTAADIFGNRKYEETVKEVISRAFENAEEQDQIDEQFMTLRYTAYDSITKPIVNTIIDHFENNEFLKPSDKKNLENFVNNLVNKTIDKQKADFEIKSKENEANRQEELDKSFTKEDDETINKKHDIKSSELVKQCTDNLKENLEKIIEKSQVDGVELIKKCTEERQKDSNEEEVRARLRGFSRTIPAFLMAYGDKKDITLQNFDTIIPDQVFQQVTNITIEQFRFLRDGGNYTADDGSTQHFKGGIFDPIVFNDSVKKFMGKKKSLANYFDDSHKKDIFDYIPNQKNNQIFTPKSVVKEMVDELEKENPGCFEDENNTFIDPYMKSGMFIAEIVKRLFNSKRLRELYPNSNERLNHIFAKQVYGLAPTEIIYNICISYLLGFNNEINIEKNNIRLYDSLEDAENGNLDSKLQVLFPELKN